MANSKYEYVKAFEEHSQILPETFIVVRIDGKGFSAFTDQESFAKPNDMEGLRVMNEAAMQVCEKFNDVLIAYG